MSAPHVRVTLVYGADVDGVAIRLTVATLALLPPTAAEHAQIVWTAAYTWACTCGAPLPGAPTQAAHAAHLTAITGTPTHYVPTT